MRRFALILTLVLTACNAARTPLSLQVVSSEMARCPEGSYLDGQAGNLKWNYTTGLELKAFLDVYDTYGGEQILQYVDGWYDAVIDSAGTIYKYKKSNFSTDHICPGRTLFRLYDLTGKEKYRKAMDVLYDQLKDQPRTPEGGFWHKQVYPEQMWLDGLYMAQPFYAEYATRFLPDSLQAAAFSDIARHFRVVAEHTYDPQTGLYRHAWDSSHEMFWADPATGQSAHAWGRALGWYAMGLSEVLDLFPEDHPDRPALDAIFRHILEVLPKYADPQTGLWYQVLDRPGAEGNYLESTCSCMFTYVYLKAARQGRDLQVDPKALYDSLVRRFVREDADGTLTLTDCCAVAGLGGKDNRSGDYDYYIHEKITENDPKGIGPLIWAALEIER